MIRKQFKKIGFVFLTLFIIGNIIVYNHVYSFTHFGKSHTLKTKKPERLSLSEKAKTLFMGVNMPRPENNLKPNQEYRTIRLHSFKKIEGWLIEAPNPRGTIIMFHGFSSAKSDLLPYAESFNNKGYNTLLVDFMGSGGSEGNLTTIGIKESQDVKAAFEYIKQQNPKENIILFGCSMGAAAIMKAINDYGITPAKIILECPFGSFKETIEQRFTAMKLPSFPMTDLLMFHGWLQLGFNPYKHNPTDYAKKINIPTLLLYGTRDERVSRTEIDKIYNNLNCQKNLVLLDKSGHEVYLNNDTIKWSQSVFQFLETGYQEGASTPPLQTSNTLKDRIPTPTGYIRSTVEKGSYHDFLRNLKLKPEGSLVQYYNGQTKPNHQIYTAVVDLKIGNKDLHQCADAVMRLRGEYLWHQKKYDKIHFNFTNGHRVNYSEWMKGKRMKIQGNKTKWILSTEPSNTYQDFWNYMELIFMYAGTASLEKELQSIYLAEAKIGDVLIQGGYPGHAVVIVDKAVREGKSVYLLAQSYMPAQEIQILHNPANTDNNPWYELNGGIINTPEWSFNSSNLKRFKG